MLYNSYCIDILVHALLRTLGLAIYPIPSSSPQIYPLDATFDTKDLIPEDVAKGKRYRQFSGYSIQEVVDQVQADYGKIDYMVHSLANGPEVTKALLDTSRAGYLAASSASAYSLVSMVSRFAPIMNPGKQLHATGLITQ
jgi:enoyl-[acyl-carrier protein] reductase I